jgi:hypothetical protein
MYTFNPASFKDTSGSSTALALHDSKNFIPPESLEDEDYGDDYEPPLAAKMHNRAFALPTSENYHLKPLFACFAESSLQLDQIEEVVRKAYADEVLDITVTSNPEGIGS